MPSERRSRWMHRKAEEGGIAELCRLTTTPRGAIWAPRSRLNDPRDTLWLLLRRRGQLGQVQPGTRTAGREPGDAGPQDHQVGWVDQPVTRGVQRDLPGRLSQQVVALPLGGRRG